MTSTRAISLSTSARCVEPGGRRGNCSGKTACPLGTAQAKIGTLKKYAEVHELNLRPDLLPGGAAALLRGICIDVEPPALLPAPTEYAIAVARHFESHLEVDEDECLARFMNAVRGRCAAV